MIHRQNYLDAKQWLDYKRDVFQLSRKTVHKYWGAIRHLLEWSDDVPFQKAQVVRPVYPVYLRGVEVVKNYKPTGHTLSKPTQELACSVARDFYTWARRTLRQYRAVEPEWIESLRLGRFAETVRERELYTIEEVQAIVRPALTDGLREQRDKAAVALMFLSGMRVGALVTLPIKALDLEHLAVKQWPELGVATKGGKAATTYLLDIPELLQVAKAWDDVVRPALPSDGMWYARLDYDPRVDRVVLSDDVSPKAGRRNAVSKALRGLCKAVGVPYLSSHKLRHGHAVYGLKRARTIAEFKAVSQNLMHANLGITDGIYGVLTPDDVRSTITNLARITSQAGPGDQETITALEALLAKLRNGV